MALKLLSTLTILIIACFTYKVWEKTKVPHNIPQEDIWKVKTIEFAARVSHKLNGLLWYVGASGYSRSLFSFVFNSLHTGVWPFTTPDPNENVVSYRTKMSGVPVIVHLNPAYNQTKDKAALIYLHGGGWVVFDAEDPGPTLKAITSQLGMLSISVDYRLCPQHPYPAALEDAIRVVHHVSDNHKALGVDFRKIIVAGDSAGGNLAAAVAMRLKKRIRMQVLIYPVLQAFDFQTPSYRENKAVLKYILKPEMVANSIVLYGGFKPEFVSAFLENQHLSHPIRMSGYRHYTESKLIPQYLNITNLTSLQVMSGDTHISHVVEKRLLDPYFMPLMAPSLDGLTNAYIVTGQHDILRDDGLMYAARLQNASNVKVRLQHYKEGFHIFFHFSSGPLKLAVAERALNDLIQFLRDHVILETFSI